MSEQKGVWRTVSGRKVFIADGQTLTEAMRASGKFSKADISAASGGGSTKSYAADSDKTSIKDQVKASQAQLKGTKVVAVIPKGKMTTDFKTAATQLKVSLDKNGGKVSRKGFGDIQVGSRILGAKKYLKTAADVAAIAAIPSVLQNGIQIGEHKNHKGRGYSTVTFAGKVTIAGKTGVLAITVMRTTGDFYKVHRVLTPSGDVFTT